MSKPCFLVCRKFLCNISLFIITQIIANLFYGLLSFKPLPELSRIPGLVLSGSVFSHCITVVEFLQCYGKVLGLQVPKDIPSLVTLQEGLLGLGKSQSELLDLLINLVSAVLHDPGLPSYYQVC